MGGTARRVALHSKLCEGQLDVWRYTVSPSAGFLPLKGCMTPCRLTNLPTCQKNTEMS